jgi:putative membrane protein
MIQMIASVLVGLVALEHLYFLYLEMFVWETKGKEIFKGSLPPELFKPTKTLAANQGLYNGFLAAGLIWTFFITDGRWSFYIAVFFLTCIIIAGLFGAVTASKKIFFVQALPALIALIVLHLR